MTKLHQEIRFATSADGARIAYAQSGRGYPLVRTAHWMTHVQWDWQTPVWGPWLEALSAHWRLLRYDSRGCGLSDRDTPALALETVRASLTKCGKVNLETHCATQFEITPQFRIGESDPSPFQPTFENVFFQNAR